MKSITEAKRELGQELRPYDGFVGIGIGDDEIRIYVRNESMKIKRALRERWGDSYEGYPINVIESSGFHTLS